MYHLEKEDLYLSGTGEIFINSFHKDEILDEEDIEIKPFNQSYNLTPILYCAIL